MESTLLALRLLLAVVFATAAAGKLLDRSGSRRALAAFGVPVRLTGAGALALPLAELAIAAALVFPSSARWGALAALVLLLAFMVGIANALAHQRAPDCHCFGQLHSAPAGAGTLARNGALAVLAAIVAWRGPGPPIDAWLAARSAAELVVVGAGVVLAAAAAAALYSRSRRLALERAPGGAAWLRERSGLLAGAPAPGFELAGACGGKLTLASLCARDRPVMLLFTTPGCGPCAELYTHVARWQATFTSELTIAVLSIGSAAENRHLCEESGIGDVLLADVSLFSTYQMPGTPSAVVVTPEGTIASATANSQVMIEELIRLATRSEASREPWKQLSPAS